LLAATLERGEFERGVALLDAILPGDLPEADRVPAARLLLGAGQASRSLEFLAELDVADALREQARAYVLLERLPEARQAYRRALELNATLEDRELDAVLREGNLPGRGEGRLRVIANDDTDDDELRRLIHPAGDPIAFADVGGLEAVKQQIRRRIIVPFQKPTLFARFKRRVGGGILMYGPPGCGKTMLARATAG
jgi:transitional endoplasmic reticulum ATPase